MLWELLPCLGSSGGMLSMLMNVKVGVLIFKGRAVIVPCS